MQSASIFGVITIPAILAEANALLRDSLMLLLSESLPHYESIMQPNKSKEYPLYSFLIFSAARYAAATEDLPIVIF